MGRQAIIAMLCLFTSKEILSDTVLKSLALDNVGAESAPRLYRNVPVYASSAPYAAYSIQFPTLITAPNAAASRILPVKEAIQNAGYLRDSYGNRFVGSPQSFAYKTVLPQQFLQLQELPSHLSQPLVAATPNYQYKQPSPFVVGSHYTLPLQRVSPHHHFSAPQQVAYQDSIKTFAPPSSTHTQVYGHPTAQQQSTSNKAVYTNVHSQGQLHGLKNGQQFQRIQEAPKDVEIIKEDTIRHRQQIQKGNEQLQSAPDKDTYITTVVNGQKTVINLKTKPALPLLDLSLLEPLTFDNPLVPQVQHFLPRINQATYHKLPKPSVNENKNYQKEFSVQKTKSYDSGVLRGKPLKGSPRKKQKQPSNVSNTHEKEAPVNPTVTIKDVSNASPEISYEINSPNYKETYSEKAVSYNKETQSEPVHYTYGTKTEKEPVHYTYGTKTEKEPVHYSYVHNSKEPLNIKEENYQTIDQGPKQLIYNFKTEEHPKEQNEKGLTPPQESENSGESDELNEDGSLNQRPIEQHEHYDESPKTHNRNSEHREEQYHHPSNKGHHREIQNPNHYYSQPRQVSVKNAEQFHPITHYEENIRLIPEHRSAHIKVDPNQHIQNGPSYHNPQSNPTPGPQQQSHQSHTLNNPQQDHPSPSRPHIAAPEHIQEKSRRVIMLEETPEEMHSLREQVMAEMIDQEENNEEDFEKAYKNAAFGFPSYHKDPVESEKEIYNPDSYGVPRDEYDMEDAPFQQYHDESDEFPKTARLNYKDTRDKTKEDYYLGYSVSRPESLTDRYRNKVDYYKLYKQQKPERYTDRDEEQNKENDDYRATQYVFKPVPEQKPKQTFAQYKSAPQIYEYDYSKERPRDNSAYASRPLQHYKSKTHFVEPQFQYGFEPISLPILLDSELATMASNNSPESEKPGMRKNFIKKTGTSKRREQPAGIADRNYLLIIVIVS